MKTMSKNERPNISVIVPVYNDPNGIKNTLSSLISQEYPEKSYEVLVIDNNSNDKTPHVIEEYIFKKPNLVKKFSENKIQSSYAARNKGIKKSNGSILAFIDSDMVVESKWLSKAIESMRRKKAEVLACNVEIYIPKHSNNIFAKYDKYTGIPVKEYIMYSNFAPTCCIFVEKRVFDEAGLFDSRLVSSGDYEFGNRISEMGIKIHYDENIIMYHPARTSFKSLVKKSIRIGRGNQQMSKYYPENSWSLYDLRNYLPTNPIRFMKRVRDRGGGIYHSLFFYTIDYIFKLSECLGRIIEIRR